MRQHSQEYLIILFIGGILAMNYPLLDIFNRSWAPFGIPLLYFYLYLTWLVLVVALIAVVERSEVRESGAGTESNIAESETAPQSDDSRDNPPTGQP